MSDFQRGPGWWLASDGRWYPPEDAPLSMLPPPTAEQRATAGPEVVGIAGKSARDKAREIERDAERWDTGADGEEATAARLEALPPGFHVLHDLHVPASTANIDHLVVGPTGAWLIDSKKYKYPLRFDGDTIWSGKFPKSKDIDSVSSYARSAATVLHVPVMPVLSFVGQAVPPGAEVIAGVRLVNVDDLLTLVSLPGPAPLADVDSVARLARTLRTPTPARKPDTSPQTPITPMPMAAPSGDRPSLAWALGLVATIVVLLALAGWLLGRSRDALERLATGPTTTTVALPRLDGPTIPIPSGEARVGLICTTAGAGWEAVFNWPVSTDPTHVPVAYEVVSLTQGIVVDPKLWPNKQTLPKPLTGLPPNLKLVFAAQGILADGSRLAPTISTRTTSDKAC
ncbi:MAG: nuclease-related domain-containing protein [Acidimicrobiales bacterium]